MMITEETIDRIASYLAGRYDAREYPSLRSQAEFLGTGPVLAVCFSHPLAFFAEICHNVPVPRKGCRRGGRL